MGQKGKPDADVYDLNWSPASGSALFKQLNEDEPVDTTLVSAEAAQVGSTFEVALSEAAVPGGLPQTLQVRLRRTDTGSDQGVKVSLLEGYRFVGTWAVDWSQAPSTQFQTYSFELTAEQAASIGDYGDLSVLVSVGSPLTTDCQDCAGGAAWQFTFTPSGIANGTCDDCAGVNVPTTLSYAGGCLWKAQSSVCGGTTLDAWTFFYVAAAAEWHLQFGPGGCVWSAAGGWDCKSALTLSLVGATGNSCSNYPAQITLSPV